MQYCRTMRSVGVRLGSILFVLLAAAPGLAVADPPPPDADPDTEIARRHFDRGTALYGEGKYAEAIAEFEAARNAKPVPALDYNIGRAYDRMEHPRDAIEAYERYLTRAPNAPDAAEVRARVSALKERTAAPATAAAPPPVAATAAPPPLPPPAYDSPPLLKRHRIATWAVGGAGLALLAGSLAAGLVAHSRYGTLNGECAADGACNMATAPDAQSAIDSGHAAGLASDVLLGVGLATVATAVVLFFVEGRHPVERHAWRLTPAPGGVAFSWGGP